MPDSRTLEDCQVPVFKTHPTPINVSVRPEPEETGVFKGAADSKTGRVNPPGGAGSPATRTAPGNATVDQGCACIIL